MASEHENDYDIESFMSQLLETHRRVDIAEAEFRRMLGDDDDLMSSYREWCDDQGTNVRYGFGEFAETYFEENTRIWDTLDEYDDDQQ